MLRIKTRAIDENIFEPYSNIDAGMTTPQEATVTTETLNILLMNGVNGSAQGVKGMLRFQARVRVMASGGTVFSI